MHIAHRYVPLRFLCIMLQLVVTVALYLDRERSLYSGLDYARELTASPRAGWALPAGRQVVVTEYSLDQIATANRWFNMLVGGTITCLVIYAGCAGLFGGYIGGLLSANHSQLLKSLVARAASGGHGLLFSSGSLVEGVTDWATTPFDGSARCAAGLMLPSIMPSPLNAVTYLLLLFWSFLGVSIGADVFMMAV